MIEEHNYEATMPQSKLWFVKQHPFILRKVEQFAREDSSYELPIEA